MKRASMVWLLALAGCECETMALGQLGERGLYGFSYSRPDDNFLDEPKNVPLIAGTSRQLYVYYCDYGALKGWGLWSSPRGYCACEKRPDRAVSSDESVIEVGGDCGYQDAGDPEAVCFALRPLAAGSAEIRISSGGEVLDAVQVSVQ